MDFNTNPHDFNDDQHSRAPRISEEVNPQNLATLFSNDPECASTKTQDAPLSRTMAFAGGNIDDELDMKKLQVFVRIRPTQPTKSLDKNENCVYATSKHILAIAPPESSQAYKLGDRGQTYSFTHVFSDSTTQEDYYQSSAAPLVRDLFRNPQHNSVMMAYGITAAGKTHTIHGTSSSPGVIPRALQDVFKGLEGHAEGPCLSVRVSYCEIYNECMYDLLVYDAHHHHHKLATASSTNTATSVPSGGSAMKKNATSLWVCHRPALKLMEDSKGRVTVVGLSEVNVSSVDEALAVLHKGAKQRQRAETGLNFSSSRSHSIFAIHLVRHPLNEQVGEKANENEKKIEYLGHISFVDLAGSERAQRTGNSGLRLKESVAINSSLMTLGRCLEALRWNQQQSKYQTQQPMSLRVVPYRESKVTHLFRDALHGYGRIILSVHVSPSASDYDETAHVLKYAALATHIGTLQHSKAPRRTIKAVTPSALRRAKRKAEEKEQQNVEESVAPSGAELCSSKKRTKRILSETVDDDELVYDVVRKCRDENAPKDGIDDENNNNTTIDPSSRGEILASTPHDTINTPQRAAIHATKDATPPGMAGIDDDNRGDDSSGEDKELLIASLRSQVQQLLSQLQEAEERIVGMEGEIRDEVASEMAQLLGDMEEGYKERVAEEIAAVESRMLGANGGCIDGTARMDENTNREMHALRAELELYKKKAQVHADRCIEAENKEQEAIRDASTAREELRCTTALLEEERSRAAALAVALSEARRKSEDLCTIGPSTQLRHCVTQLEANQAMELEMAEQQTESLRKENIILKQQLVVAMATLESMSSPTRTLMQRMVSACPAGQGCGPAGTPHDVALARARQATMQEREAAMAAVNGGGDGVDAPGGTSSGGERLFGSGSGEQRKQRSRFAEEAFALSSQPESMVMKTMTMEGDNYGEEDEAKEDGNMVMDAAIEEEKDTDAVSLSKRVSVRVGGSDDSRNEKADELDDIDYRGDGDKTGRMEENHCCVGDVTNTYNDDDDDDIIAIEDADDKKVVDVVVIDDEDDHNSHDTETTTEPITAIIDEKQELEVKTRRREGGGRVVARSNSTSSTQNQLEDGDSDSEMTIRVVRKRLPPKKRAKRTTRATTKSDDENEQHPQNQNEPSDRSHENITTPPPPKQPGEQNTTAAAKTQQRRRLLQSAAPMTAAMRSALGGLAGHELHAKSPMLLPLSARKTPLPTSLQLGLKSAFTSRRSPTRRMR